MFATVIVVLPSAYTGGQVCVSHASSAETLDFASSSAFSTSVLAWYTDVKHEVKPITTGYRFVLSYNLVHNSPGIPRPSLADIDSAFSHLRHVLRKWSKGAYEAKPETDIIAYLLDHRYSVSNLNQGSKALKGMDAHKIANVRLIAEELGYLVCLANLLYIVTGVADNDDSYSWKQQRYSYDEEDEEAQFTPTMVEILQSDLRVSNVVDLDGNSLLDPRYNLHISSDSLVPQNPFEDVEPDHTELEAYMGNVSHRVSPDAFL
jgi:hypothetical protein